MLKKFWSLLFIAGLFCSLPVSAVEIRTGEPATATVTARAEAGEPAIQPITVSLSAKTEEPRIGDPVRVEVKISAQPGLELLDFDYGERLGEWEVERVKKGELEMAAGQGTRLDTITLTTYLPGEIEVPSLTVPFRLPDGKAGEFRSAPLKIKVAPLPLREGEKPGQWRDLKSSQGMISTWWFIGLGLLAAAAAGFWWYYQRRKKLEAAAGITREPSQPPEEAARQRLKALQNSNHLASGESKIYYIELSDILRRYLEGRFNVPAIDRTTHELFRELKATNIKRQEHMVIRNMLERSDMVKFAKALPSENEAHIDWQAVADFVERTTATKSTETQVGADPVPAQCKHL
ncbi:LPXTG cell wall anchor domain-containing protein [bacterium]|nr:LPXTG cell wall anchor domain-containing protein [bacterium]